MFYTALIVIICILLILVVLVQNSKGGGLDSNLASSTQAFGAKKTTEVIEKATWGLAGALALMCILYTGTISTPSGEQSSNDDTEQVDEPAEDGETGDQ